MLKENITTAVHYIITTYKHRKLVHKFGKYLGIGKQTLFHDLSSYSKDEFSEAIYFTFDDIPAKKNAEAINRYSKAWLHHIGRNKHHLEYWIYMNDSGIFPIEIPVNYVIEFICDTISEQIQIHGKKYTFSDYHTWWKSSRDLFPCVHPKTLHLIDNIVNFLKEYFSTIPIIDLDPHCWTMLKERLPEFYKLKN